MIKAITGSIAAAGMLLVASPAAHAGVVVPGGTYGFTGCGATIEDVRIAEPGGPLVSVGSTEVDHRGCLAPLSALLP